MNEHCAVHPERASIATCPRCGTFACTTCWVRAEGFCAACVDRGPIAPLPVESDGWRVLPATLIGVLFRPTAFFARFPDGSVVRPLLVATFAWMIVGGLGQVALGHSLEHSLRVLPWSVAVTVGVVLSIALAIGSDLALAWVGRRLAPWSTRPKGRRRRVGEDERSDPADQVVTLPDGAVAA